MFHYILNWQRLGQIRYPCYLDVPKGLLLRLYLVICLQAVIFCLLPLPTIWMAYLSPVAGMIVFQMIAWLRAHRRFGYSVWPPIILTVVLCLATFAVKNSLFEVL